MIHLDAKYPEKAAQESARRRRSPTRKNRRLERRTPKRAHHKSSPERAPLQELKKAVTQLSHLPTALKIRKAVHANH
jgi:hypothetical protein